MDTKKILKAGEIAKQVRDFAEKLIKPKMPLLEIAEKIEDKIQKLGGKPAFPTNLSINNIAAHYTPSHNDETLAHGLLKVDFGVHVDGWLADTAFSIDLENNEENKKLIKASKDALKAATDLIAEKTTLSQIGTTIQNTIESQGFSPIINLSGHSMEQHELHAGITIPNYDDEKNIELTKGLYAIEPFATNGSGKVHDGSPSGIYMLVDDKNPRSPTAREVLEFIAEEYQTLPFCSRWITKKFGSKALFGLKELENNGNLHHFTQLVETPGSKVAQAEHTILIDKEVKVTTN
jgi:methionyl aminopeptidase